ncbi:MAG TPA: YjgN family protein, partial [Solimonas sp.]|nr:YjgN family protein [Solimonas sp.]
MSTDDITTQQLPLAPEAFRFNGSGGGYFRIWIVNLLLTLLTFGIYSAWAKVRRLKYFYGNTELAGASFDYHGSPIAIFKGRLFALGLFTLYTVATNVISWWTLVALVFLAVVLPWLLRNSFRFRMQNSRYRGLRFGFHGSNAGAYATFLFYPVLMFVTFYLAGPLFHARLKQYQHGNARYGTTHFGFDATVGEFYKAYLPIFVLMFLGVFGVGFAAALMVPAMAAAKTNPQALVGVFITMFVVLMAASLLITPLWQVRTQNLIWNRTRLGEHRFESTMRVLPLLGIHLTNFLGILLTLGLFAPWAMVRVARYRAACLQMLPASSLDL